ncbi:alpha/beta fold hydrolase [Arthrobacter sp. NPDC090010]|uniref:alpha/beta fold hydrolase n=1 Tax=Arthrobacter sp. NPDC090010 TaxID=3363942 RepID=UPI00382153DD
MMTQRNSPPEPSLVTVDGAEIATWVLEPDGPAAGEVVLCHGTPWSSQIWWTAAHDLSQDFRVFLWDMPGYGASEKSARVSVDLASQGRRLAQLVHGWGLVRPHLVAHDVGGAVALRAHLMHGIDYADLFLWDVVTLDPWGSPFFRLVSDNTEVFAQLPPALHAALLKEYIAGSSRGLLSARDIDVLARPWLDGAGQAAFYRQIAALETADTRPIVARLGEVRCRTRIGWGSADPWIPCAQAYELQARLPGPAEVVELAGIGHLAPVECPSGVITAIRTWLAAPG